MTVRNPSDIEDAAQNAALIVLTKLDSFRPDDDEAFAQRLSTVLNFVSLSHYKARVSAGVGDDEVLDAFQNQSIGLKPDATEEIDFNRLPEDIRFYAERVIEGYEPSEIAKLMGYSSQLPCPRQFIRI